MNIEESPVSNEPHPDVITSLRGGHRGNLSILDDMRKRELRRCNREMAKPANVKAAKPVYRGLKDAGAYRYAVTGGARPKQACADKSFGHNGSRIGDIIQNELNKREEARRLQNETDEAMKLTRRELSGTELELYWTRRFIEAVKLYRRK